MDVHCCHCGEPWDQYHLRHELADMDAEELAAEGWKFGTSRLVVMHCPCCPKDGDRLEGADQRAAITAELAILFGDDEDGLASTLEDFDL